MPAPAHGCTVLLDCFSAEEVTRNSRAGLFQRTEFFTEKVREGLQVLPVEWRHAAAAEHLPPHHRDPFDRLLIAQAQVEGLRIVTADPVYRKYGIGVVW
jgi:PIN domain nuclease of toxin-antitoxin system